MSFIFIINLAIALIATGLIWTIQLVHYPSMKFIPEEKFTAYHNFHSQRISILAIPIMLIELFTSLELFYQNGSSYNHIFTINLILVILIWISTFLIQVPMHNTLSSAKNARVLNHLILSNWIRTILWTARSLLMVLYLSVNLNLI
jgi:hypothetical protein